MNDSTTTSRASRKRTNGKVQVNIELTAEQRAELKAAAKSAGLSLGAYFADLHRHHLDAEVAQLRANLAPASPASFAPPVVVHDAVDDTNGRRIAPDEPEDDQRAETPAETPLAATTAARRARKRYWLAISDQIAATSTLDDLDQLRAGLDLENAPIWIRDRLAIQNANLDVHP